MAHLDALQAYLENQFLRAMETLALHPLNSDGPGRFIEDFRPAAVEVNERCRLDHSEPYVWECNEVPIPPVPFVALGGQRQAKSIRLAVWGLNPLFGAGVIGEKADATGVGQLARSYPEYARFHVGVNRCPPVLAYAVRSPYYRTLWKALAYLDNPEGVLAQIANQSRTLGQRNVAKRVQKFWDTAENGGLLQMEWFPYHSRKTRSMPPEVRPPWLSTYHDVLLEIMQEVLDPQGVVLAVGKDSSGAVQHLLETESGPIVWQRYEWEPKNQQFNLMSEGDKPCFSVGNWGKRRVVLMHEFWNRKNGCVNGNERLAEVFQYMTN